MVVRMVVWPPRTRGAFAAFFSLRICWDSVVTELAVELDGRADWKEEMLAVLPLTVALAPAGEVGLVGRRSGGPIIMSSPSEANGSAPSMSVIKGKYVQLCNVK